jgi:hypothetical protein
VILGFELSSEVNVKRPADDVPAPAMPWFQWTLLILAGFGVPMLAKALFGEDATTIGWLFCAVMAVIAAGRYVIQRFS